MILYITMWLFLLFLGNTIFYFYNYLSNSVVNSASKQVEKLLYFSSATINFRITFLTFVQITNSN